MRVIINTTKGKKDRMELAATENAKVCTSVRKRYFTVATNKLVRRRGAGTERAEGPSLMGETAELGRVGTRLKIVSNEEPGPES
jgi:hypothetical protein